MNRRRRDERWVPLYSEQQGFDMGYWTMEVTVNSKTGAFRSTLPKGVMDRLLIKHVESPTLEGLKKLVKDTTEKAREITATHTKVILYEVETKDWGAGVSIGIAAAVFDENVAMNPADGKKQYRYDKLESTIPPELSTGGLERTADYSTHRARNVLPWCPQTEALFSQMGLGMNRLAEMIGQVFKTETTILEFALSRKALPFHKGGKS